MSDFEQCRAHTEGVLADKRLKPDLVRKARAVLADVNAKSNGAWELGVFEGHRTAARQLKLLARGVSKVRHSKHMVGKAVDFVFWVKGEGWSWSHRLPWRLVGSSARAHGLTWGGDWQRFKDYPHCEL